MAGKDEYDAEVRRRNYLRAANIAEEGGLGAEALRTAREAGFKQLLGEWFNFRAAEATAREWGYGPGDVTRLCNEIIKDFEDREKREGREFQVFDIGRMDHTRATKLVAQFRDRFR